jgi:ElaB/YqjD/DUF883 family membrane-anchored ribosome-binding protein
MREIMNQARILSELTHDVEDLLGRLADNQSPEIRDLRDRLDRTIAETRNGLTQVKSQASEFMKNYAASVDDYVHDSPWVALGTAVATAGVLGFLAGTLLTTNRRTWM